MIAFGRQKNFLREIAQFFFLSLLDNAPNNLPSWVRYPKEIVSFPQNLLAVNAKSSAERPAFGRPNPRLTRRNPVCWNA